VYNFGVVNLERVVLKWIQVREREREYQKRVVSYLVGFTDFIISHTNLSLEHAHTHTHTHTDLDLTGSALLDKTLNSTNVDSRDLVLVYPIRPYLLDVTVRVKNLDLPFPRRGAKVFIQQSSSSSLQDDLEAPKSSIQVFDSKTNTLNVTVRGDNIESDRLSLQLFVGRRTGIMNAEPIGKLTDPLTKSSPLVSSLCRSVSKTNVFSLYPGEDNDEDSARIEIVAKKRMYKKLFTCEVVSTSWIVPENDMDDEDLNDFTAKMELQEQGVSIAKCDRGRLSNIYVDSLKSLSLSVSLGIVVDSTRVSRDAYGFKLNSKVLSSFEGKDNQVKEINLAISADSFARIGAYKIPIESLGHRSSSDPRKFDTLPQFVAKWYVFYVFLFFLFLA